VINQGVFGALMVINSLPVERALSLRERVSGTYFASGYFTAKVIADTLVQAPVPIIFVSSISIRIFIWSSCIFSRVSFIFWLDFKPVPANFLFLPYL